MEYMDLTELKNGFVDGHFNFPDGFEINGVPYLYLNASEYSMQDIIGKNYKPMMVYSTRDKFKDDAKKVGLEQWIIFLWGYVKNKLVPYDIRTMSKARASARVITEAPEDNDIGSTVEVKITNLPGSGLLKGKTDTGADVSSLHADEYRINRENGTVTFKCPQLSPNELTMQLVDHQAVKSSDGGTEYRPIIELNIKINGKLINGVMFNLNDRSHMEFPVLVGRNALMQGKFKIDPSLDEGKVKSDEIDWDLLQEEMKDVQPYHKPLEDVQPIYEMLKESDISFSDLVRFIRTDVTNVMESLDD